MSTVRTAGQATNWQPYQDRELPGAVQHARASPAAGPTTAATVSRHTAATRTAGTPARTTTLRWKPTHRAGSGSFGADTSRSE
jgi:hypothetical protein